MNEQELARDALMAIPPDIPREEWIKAGMGAHAGGISEDDWHDWCSGGQTYAWRAAHDVFKSFKPGGGVGVGSLYAMAKEYGWKRPTNGHAAPPAPPARPQAPRKPQAEATTASALFARFLPAPADHPYIVKKQGMPEGLRVVPAGDPLRVDGKSMAGWLAVPAMDGQTVCTVQFISGTEKLSLGGHSFGNGYFTVGSTSGARIIYLGEGIGHAWAAWKATGRPAVACLGASRMRTVAKALKEQHPGAQIVLVPDVGMEARAQAIAADLGLQCLCMPDGWPANSDINDLMQREGADAVEELLARGEPGSPQADPLALLERFFVTDDQVKNMTETQIIWRGIIAASHLIAVIAPPNGGKTSIFKFAAGELARSHTVLFFQEDASAGDLPALHEHAKQHGYRMLNSTLANSRPEDQIDVLHEMVQSGASLERYVMIFDTLKKYLDLMSKGGARQFFQLMRSLTQRGATVILLGHTNKYVGPDGKMIFEGVGDVKNDVDELFYIDATKKDLAGLVTLTMVPDKVRCLVKQASFELDTHSMAIRALDQVVDVATLMEKKRRLEADQPVIECINAILKDGGMNYTTVLEMATAASGQSKRIVGGVLTRYLSPEPTNPDAFWTDTKLRTNNIRYIALKPAAGDA